MEYLDTGRIRVAPKEGTCLHFRLYADGEVPGEDFAVLRSYLDQFDGKVSFIVTRDCEYWLSAGSTDRSCSGMHASQRKSCSLRRPLLRRHDPVRITHDQTYLKGVEVSSFDTIELAFRLDQPVRADCRPMKPPASGQLLRRRSPGAERRHGAGPIRPSAAGTSVQQGGSHHVHTGRQTCGARLRAAGTAADACRAVALPFPWVRVVGTRALVSGHGPTNADGVTRRSRWERSVTEVTEEQAYVAARLTGLAILGSLKRELGSLDRIAGWTRAFGMVNSAPGFVRQPAVINGFSELIVDVFGPERGAHARSAVGLAELPFRIPVEIEAECELRADGH